MTSKEDLKQLLQEVIRQEVDLFIKNQLPAKPAPAEQVLLTRMETAKLLHISLVTLTDWTKRGLPAHRGRKDGRVLFMKDEVVTWLRKNPRLKNVRG